ncbi:AAA family ATPase, partial [Sebaldella sp. S0638]|uniref:AAA family ATPase n=1 Tax=Sebaldella sp. S0638 TaxID=2957809 RepID=UPI0020A21925
MGLLLLTRLDSISLDPNVPILLDHYTLSNDILENLKSFFDRSYEIELNNLNNFCVEYKKLTSKINSYIENIQKKEFNFTAHSDLKVSFNNLKNLIELNNEKLEKKLNNPSQKVEIENIRPLLQNINNILYDYNERIDSNNKIVNNRQQEFDSCKDLFWKYTILNLKDKIKNYLKKSNGLNKASTNINSIILETKKEIDKLDSEIKTLEASTTNITPTIQFINKTLKSFDFKGFYIKENSKGTYKLVRDDETPVKDSLSEGEYNFITFLYFYYLVYGSHEKTGLTSSKIIVIDDPVSSLDNHVLFIVSNLVKKIRDDCRENKNGIIQLFIFTHNTYFHKEINFLGSRDHYGKDEVFFGILNKKDNQTILTSYKTNPINSSYQLMWKELNSANVSHTTCYNTMRRILEYYFNIIGANNYEKLINKFEGNDKYVCRTLISIINDNSHDITDDFHCDINIDNIENHKKIFKLIFEKLGHSQHYDMMSQIE